jgi:hypothetical protein
MSGVIKAIGKAFKKVVKAVKKVVKAIVKIAKPLLIAAAVYFTAGVAIGAFGGASVISSLPGWGAGGLFSSAASSLGGWTGFAAGGQVAGAAAGTVAATGAAETAAAAAPTVAAPTVQGAAAGTAAAEGAAATGAAGGAAAAPGGVAGIAKNAVTGLVNYAKTPGGGYTIAKGIEGAAAYMSEQDKIEQEQEREDELARRAGFFGMDRQGTQIDLPTVGTIPSAAASLTGPQTPGIPLPGAIINSQRQQQQAQVAQQEGETGVPLTPSQLLEMQRRQQIRNPTG